MVCVTNKAEVELHMLYREHEQRIRNWVKSFLEVIRFREYITCLRNENGCVRCCVMETVGVRCLYVT